jgi:hypothetical protein
MLFSFEIFIPKKLKYGICPKEGGGGAKSQIQLLVFIFVVLKYKSGNGIGLNDHQIKVLKFYTFSFELL